MSDYLDRTASALEGALATLTETTPEEVPPAEQMPYLHRIAAAAEAIRQAISELMGSVKYSEAQTLTEAQKEQARTNINAAKNETMAGATTSAAGAAGLVPAPASGASARFLCADGTWAAAITPADAQTITGAKTFQGAVVVPTPGAADDSQNAATTAWVRALIGTIADLETENF